MKRKKILAGQDIKKKKAGRFSKAWKRLQVLSAFFLKLTFAVVVLVIISLGFLVLYGYLLTSPYIRLEQVEVLGVDEELKSELLEMAQLNYEHSLLAVDLNAIKEQLEKHPWVRSVDVEKSFPHLLVIRAERQEPLAIVLDGRLYYMNRSGDLFKEVLSDERVDFPVITGLSEKKKKREEQIKIMVKVLELFRSEESPWDLDHLCEAHLKEDGTLHLYVSFMPGQIRVQAGHLSEKLEEMKRLVEHLDVTGRIHMVKAIHFDYGEGAAVAFEKG
ncbi:MAG: FtsQ-type POTRA domain-containing protein [Deltaproteobacteria bacterium]|nr:FtsQ-type POTRA domain-containing protein [Deltaproteobacteria bacterium]